MKIDDQTSLKISWLKSFMILEVVYIHMGSNYVKSLVDNQEASTSFYRFFIYLLSDTIASSAVPLFFVISGLLFYSNFLPTYKIYIRKIKSRITTLAIPYLFWNSMFLVFKLTIQITPFLKDKLGGDSKRVLDYTTFDYFNAFAGWTTYPVSYQFWFVRDLMIMVFVSPIIWLGSKYLSWLLPITLFILWSAGVDRIININYASWIFFSAGCLIAQDKVPSKLASNQQHLLLIAYSILCVLLAIDHIYHLGLPTIFHKLILILGVPAMWYGADILLKLNWLKSSFLFMAPFAFFVYATHEPILGITMRVINKISFLSDTHEILFIVYLSCPILLTILLLQVGLLLQKHFRKLYGIVTGDRA